jgi:DNA-binding HxlR family transcriptional regulator
MQNANAFRTTSHSARLVLLGRKMDEKKRILDLLTKRPHDASEMARMLNISRSMMFSMLRTMERDGAIMWNGHEWTLPQQEKDKPEGSQEGGQDLKEEESGQEGS